MHYSSPSLPHGCRHGDFHIQRVHLRQLTGEDERFLADCGERMPRVERETALLARLVRFPDPGTPLAVEAIRKLTAGDREALLLHIYRGFAGERLAGMLRCPVCGDAVTLDLAVLDLLAPPSDDCPEEYPREVAGRRTVLRPVTGADLEALNDGAGPGAERLLRACVVSADPPLPPAPLPPEEIKAFSEALAALDPQADIVLDARCPSCSRAFPVFLDAWDALLRALSPRRGRIEEEVHALAFYYHWTEEAILALPLNRRRRYLDLIAGSLAGGRL